MTQTNLQETLSRTIKMAMDTGEATSVSDAEKIFNGYHLAVEVGPDVASSATLQALLLTIVNTGRRCFLGGVHVGGITNVDLLVHWRGFRTLREAIHDLRGNLSEDLPSKIPRIVIGDAPDSKDMGVFAIRATFDGWSGGVTPLNSGKRLPEKIEFIPAGVLAGSLAVSEAFQHIRGGSPLAGRRDVGLSLWNPEPTCSWLDPANTGPVMDQLPSKLWLIGLGHLGQAFLWTVGFLPYARPEEVSIVLQDFDILADANDSTSPLTFGPVKKERKTRAISKWCEERGFNTLINERLFSGNFSIALDEPMVGICGVDNALARASLEDVGFERVIEAGLGKGDQEYLSFQIHTFPGPQKARERWSSTKQVSNSVECLKPAYEALADEGMDDCGIASLAGRSVGASFVGTMVSTLMVAELLKLVNGSKGCGLIDGTLRSLERREVVENVEWMNAFNPGVTAAVRPAIRGIVK